jgi:CubicO group peptidase (beta-lactamase class C family)
MRFSPLWALLVTAVAAADAAYPPAQLPDPKRESTLKAAYPEIDAIFSQFATAEHIPGLVWGIVVDNHLAHVGTFGVADLTSKTPISADTAFRIASMTKSFTALAILQLRDQGTLSLEDPVSRWLPEFARMALPTRDSAPLTVRQLLSHSAGLPEDNPWGDRQLAASDADLTRWLERGIPFSTAPGTRYEYSNYAYGLLGRIVARASGMPYETYVNQALLQKLHMSESTFEFSRVPAARRALGYRLLPDSTYREEPPLPQGAFSSMGGLITTANDLGKYVAFQLSAWPPRDDPDAGPVRRSSIREMSHLWTPSNLTVTRKNGELRASETGYGFGLRVTTDCRFEHIVSHGGGLPGFGSYMAWLPEYGVGIIAMATLTYAAPADAVSGAFDALRRSGGLERRETPVSAQLAALREPIFKLWNQWDEHAIGQIAAMNLLLDAPAAQRRVEIDTLKSIVGECTAGPVRAENWLRGQFNLSCTHGTVGVFFTLAPTQPPALQHLSFHKLDTPTQRLGAPTGAPAGVSCTDGDLP